jgi:transposase InsO family protein
VRALEIARRYTRSYSPWTKGKAEALIKTLLNEWAYRFAYPSSEHRSRALAAFLRSYNRRRPHGSLGGRPPISRVSHLCGQYI